MYLKGVLSSLPQNKILKGSTGAGSAACIDAHGDPAYPLWAPGAFQKVQLSCSLTITAVKPFWISQIV